MSKNTISVSIYHRHKLLNLRDLLRWLQSNAVTFLSVASQSVNDSLASGYGAARYAGNFLLPRSVLGTTLHPSQTVVGAIPPVVKWPQYKSIHCYN
jgi:hypothetical protein